MKKLSLWLMGILAVCLSFISVACSCDSSEKIPDEISLNKTAITLEVGESQTLKATTNVSTDVQWTSSDDSIATVDGGVVNALAAGTATITAQAGTATATCTVTVNEAVEYVDLMVDKTVVELKEGGASVLVTATFTVNDEVCDCDFTWTTENDAIATVENGHITPVGAGSTIVTVSVEYKGETYAADVNVEVKPDEHIQVSKGNIELALAEINDDIISDTFTATAYKASVENTEVILEFASSDETVATVTAEGGVATVTSVGEGTCTISVFYTSTQGKIETLVNVKVSRSTVALDDMVEVPYVEGNTVLDMSGLGLQGSLESVYYAGEKVSAEDGIFNVDFVENNKDVIITVEIRTTIMIYEIDLIIVVPYEAHPKQENEAMELVDVATYDGDATTLGFPAGTETAYEITIDAANGGSGWTNRMLINAAGDKDVVVFDVIVKEIADSASGFRFTMWPAKNVLETQGSYGVNPNSVDPSADADFDRKVFVLGADNNQPSTFAVGTLYTVYFFLNKGENYVHFSMFTDGTFHVANIRCINADEVVNDPTLPPPPISQGEARNDMPTFDGDVTTLGFEEGTTVYQINGAQSNTNDVKLVAQVDPSGDVIFAKLDFVLSAATSSIGLWITAENTHLGYYSITPTGFTTTDGIGDASRSIFVKNANGEDVQSFEANTIYTLYINLDGREATIQVTTWANLTMYVANIDCVSEEELSFDNPLPPVVEGKEISILFIGNSFSDDTEAYMVDILLHLGYTKINVGNLYIGGCDIDTHYSNVLNDVSAYDFRMRSHNGSKYTEYVTGTVGGKKKSINFAVAYKDWDIISVQQASGSSGKANTYSNLDALVTEVKNVATNPDVEFVFNMTWAYQQNSTHAQFPDYDSDQETMYEAIVNAVQEKVTYTVVPNGTAIQNARTSLLGDNLTRDGYHLNLKIGRFIAGLTFVAKVTGVDISTFDYAPNGVTSKELEIAIESVQNAIIEPYAVTYSQVEEDVIEEKDVMPGGSNTDAVKEYDGDVTALGFAEGTTVFEYVGVDTATDRVSIKVDSANYDYVEVQFVITKGDGYFWLYGLKGGNWHNGGVGYVVDPSWIRIGDGNNTPADRTIEIFDADGRKVTSLMSNNVLYTLRVFTKVGELDEIRLWHSGSTIYFANVKQGLEADIPEPPVEGPIKQGDGATALPTYTGDVTALGFEEGTCVQYMETETITAGWWESTQSNGKTREQLAAKIYGERGKYVTVKFVTSEDIASGSVFYVWGLLGTVHTVNGGLNFTTTTHGRILDLDGKPVTSISKNTVYVLELYMDGTDTYKVANVCSTGMETYFDADSITYSDTSMEVEPPVVDDNALITVGGSNLNAVKKYDGNVTALGFAAGSTVYEYVGEDISTDKVAIKVDSTNYDYVDVELVIKTGDGYFWLYGLKGGNWHNGGVGYVVDPGWIRLGDGNNTASDRKIEIFDADGNKVTTLMSNNVLYTLRVYTKVGELDEIRIGHKGSTIYFANVTYGVEQTVTPDPDPEPQAPIVSGETTSTGLSVYDGAVTDLGFAEGTTVYQLISKSLWNDRVKIATDPSKKYLDVQFIVSSGAWYFNVWICNANGMLDGSYHVAELGGGTQHATFGEGFAQHNPNQGGAGGNTRIQVLDADGNPVIGGRTNGTIYTLRVWLDEEDVTEVHIGQDNVTMYFANIVCGDGTPADPIVPSVTAAGTNKNAVTIYKGDETALGFAAGSTVYQYVGETSNDKLGIKVDSVNYDYVDVQIVFDAASTKTWFLGFVMSGSSYLNGADAYILAGDNIRFNANASNPLDRVIQFLDADGNVVSSALETGVLYTLRVYIKANNVTEIQMRQVGVTAYLANVIHAVAPIEPTDVEIKIGDNKADPTLFEGTETTYGFAEGTEVVVVALESATDVDDKRLVLDVNPSNQYLKIDFALEFGLYGNIYVWTVTDGGERVLAATILSTGGVEAGALVDILIKDSAGNDVTDQVLVGLDSGAAEKYTLYVYYNGANEVHIGCDDYDVDFGGNILYFADAVCDNDEA